MASIVKLERRGIYSAVVTEKKYNQWATHTFVNKIFEGSAKELVASLVLDGQLDEKDIAELSAMFNVGEKDVLPEQTGSSVVNSTDQTAGRSTAASGTQTKSSLDGDVADTQKSAETRQTFTPVIS